MSAKEYFQRDAERETFYRTFYQICRRFNVTWSTATPEVRAFIEEVTRVTYEQEKAKREAVLWRYSVLKKRRITVPNALQFWHPPRLRSRPPASDGVSA